MSLKRSAHFIICLNHRVTCCVISCLLLGLGGCIYRPPGPQSDPEFFQDLPDECDSIHTTDENPDCPPRPLDPNQSQCLIIKEGDTSVEVTSTLEFSPTLVGQTNTQTLILENCGEAPLTLFNLTFQGDSALGLSLSRETPLTLPPESGEDSMLSIEINFSPLEPREYTGIIRIESDQRATPLRDLELSGLAVINACPIAQVEQAQFEVEPLDVITLDASPSRGEDGLDLNLRYQWVVIRRPTGSIAQVVESFSNPNQPANGGPPDDPTTPQAQFFVDLVGRYEFQLIVINDLGFESPSELCPAHSAEVRVTSETEDAIHIELTWHTPRDPDESDSDGSDVDLRLLHPYAWGWQDENFNCSYQNQNPDWGDPGPAGDPSLDIDDVSGAGPENINIPLPEFTDELGGPYQVGAHYYSSDSNFGDLGYSEVTLRIYLSGELEATYQRDLAYGGQFWSIARLHWTRSGPYSELDDRIYDDIP